MTQEDKMLLVKDLSSRLPYAVHVQHISGVSGILHDISIRHKYDGNDNIYDVICYTDFLGDGDSIAIEHFKPYLFPLSSMTEEELKEFRACHCLYDLHPDFQPIMCNIANEQNMFDWLNAHHFDYRGLISMGLAIDATGLDIY